MRLFKSSLTIIVLLILIGCKQTNKSLTSIELNFINDSTDKAECFSDFYKSKLMCQNKDTLLKRFAFPFKYSAIINGTNDWKNIKFNNQKELTSSDEFSIVISSITHQINFDKRFEEIFATLGSLERSLRISRIDENDRFVFFHFVTNNGQWFIKSFQEVPVFDDGGIPVNED